MTTDRAVLTCASLSFGMAMLLCVAGCRPQAADSQAVDSQASHSPGWGSVSATGDGSASPVVPATDVVSQFLDLVRRGGADSGASSLLTAKAQSELARIGRTLQPIGSPDARFQVTRAQTVPGDDESALVHSRWTEPQGNEKTLEYQVVWAVQMEEGQWRISGLAMEMDPSKDPMIVNFEDGGRMAALLAATETKASDSSSLNRGTGEETELGQDAAVDR